MGFEAQPWIAGLFIADALNSYAIFFFRGPGFGCSFLLCLASPPGSVPGLVWVTGPLYWRTRHGIGVFGPGSNWMLRIASHLHTPRISRLLFR